MMSKQFWMDAAERMIKTAVQVAVPMVAATSLDKVDWKTAGLTVASSRSCRCFRACSARVGSPADASLVTDKPGETPPPTMAEV